MKLTDAILIHGKLLLRGHQIPCHDVEDAIRHIVGIENDTNGGLPETAPEAQTAEDVPATPIPPNTFQMGLTQLLNQCSIENESDTPDFILANYLINCLAAWNNAVDARQNWWNHKTFKNNTSTLTADVTPQPA